MAGDKTASCLSCGFQNARGDQFCGSCGVFLAWEGEVQAPDQLDAEGGSVAVELPVPLAAPSSVSPDPAISSVPEAVAPGSIKCVACGLVNIATRTFCQRCGDRLKRMPVAQAATRTPQAPPASPAQVPPATSVAPVTASPDRVEQRRPRAIWRLVALGAVVVAVMVVATAAILLWGSEPVNLALGHPVNASRSLPEGPPAAAVDGTWDTELIWNSGDGPSQWIEVDLGAPSTITGVRLHVAQFPAGQTRHRVVGRATESGPEVLLHEFVGVTADPEVLEATLEPAVPGIRIVRVETLTSPSFVAWREVEVLGRP